MTLTKLRHRAAFAAGALAGLLAVPALAVSAQAATPTDAPAPAAVDLPKTVSADALPTAQMNGVAWNQLVVGNTVYVAGQFTAARPAGSAPGQNESARSNLMAYDIRTGALLSWAPMLNGVGYGLAASADGKKIYVSGAFTAVNGTTQYRVAAVDATTGALVSGFRPSFNGRVRSIAVVGNTLYAGGTFTAVGSNARVRLAAVNASTGALLPWAPTADAEVLAMVAPSSTPELVIAGRFGVVNGAESKGSAALDLSSGASLPWEVQDKAYNYGDGSAVFSLSTDGTGVYGTGYNFGGPGNFENSFAADAAGGKFRWMNPCLGDTYGSYPLGGVLYTAGHAHDCSAIGGLPDLSPRQYQWALASTTAASGKENPRNAYGWAEGTPAPTQLHWTPTFTPGSFTGQSQSTWNVAGNSDYIVYGGEFGTVNGQGQQGLVRFAVRSASPQKEGPQSGGDLTPSGTSTYPGQLRLAWRASWDRDDAALTYELLRGPSGNTTTVATTTAASEWWDRTPLALDDPSPLAGSQLYRVRATDASGTSVTSAAPADTAAPAAAGAYPTAVKADGASDYWRLGDRAGAVGVASIGSHDLKVDASQTRGVAGAAGDADTAMTFTGTTEISAPNRFGPSYKAVVPAATTTTLDGPQTYTTEAWINTTTDKGGKIIGFGNSNSDYSSSYDRQVYMTNDGRLVAGVYNGNTNTATSAKSYNDGQWHHVVATLGASGLQLYVDGVRVARNGAATQAQPFNGYWRIGGDNLNGWPDRPTSSGFAGSIDEVAVYPAALSAAQIRAHYTASGRTTATPAQPTDAYGAAVYGSGPEAFWRLQETSGTTLADSSPDGSTPAELKGSAALGGVGAPGISGSTGVTFDGAQGSTLSSPGPVAAPSTYSEELWFKTTSTRGGKLIGFGGQASGYSGNNDRHVWMDRDGTLHFGVWTGQENRVNTAKSYNDGGWHHVVATQGPAGMALYVDGALVGTNAQTQAQQYTGYWRVGGDTSWGNTENGFFDGTIDDVAIYPSALTAADVRAHFSAAGGNLPPTAEFTPTLTGTALSVDASASADADGTIASYAWTFGDGASATGATAQHTYAKGGSYTIGLTTTDDKGATTSSQQQVVVRVTPTTGVSDAYGQAVFAAGPDAYYRLDEAAGATAATDSSGLGNAGTIRNGVTTGVAGVSASVGTGTAASFNGQPGSVVIDPRRLNGPTTYSTELWFNTTSTRGGKIVGFGDGDGSWYSGNYDRHVMMERDGSLHFGVWTGQENRVDTAPGYNDGKWHHLVATQGPSGMALYVDGKSVGTNPQTLAQGYTGSWRVGGDSGWGPNENGFFDGSIDEVAFYSTALTAAQVADHHSKGTTTVPSNKVPTAAFTSTTTGLGVAVDGATSTDEDGTVASWSWAFGDGATGTGATASHTYAAAGTYQVTLTVTDDKGATGTFTSAVTVAAPVVANQAPTAAFTSSATGLAAAFDGSTSTDADGTVASYAWSFGDQATANGATASHTYAAAGTYQVTLTVTDDKGATSAVTKAVTVAAAPVAYIAADTFGRTTASGWGTAETGGAWSTSSTSAFSVAPGAGRMLVSKAGGTVTASLNAVSSDRTDLVATFAQDKASTGGGTYVSLLPRKVGSEDYRVTARLTADGKVTLSLARNAGGTTTTLRSATPSGLVVASGQQVSVRVQSVPAATGGTTLQAKVWLAGTTEPTAWTVTTTDTTASLQAAGGVGLIGYLSSSSTSAPVAITFSDLKATRA